MGETIYKHFEIFGFKDSETNEIIEAEQVTPEKILGKNIDLNMGSKFRIVGISKADFDFFEYEQAKSIKMEMPRSNEEGLLLKKLQNQVEFNFYSSGIYISNAFYNDYLLSVKSGTERGFRRLYFKNPKTIGGLNTIAKLHCEFPVANPTFPMSFTLLREGIYFQIYTKETIIINRMDFHLSIARIILLVTSIIFGLIFIFKFNNFSSMLMEDDKNEIETMLLRSVSKREIFVICLFQNLIIFFIICLLSFAVSALLANLTNFLVSEYFVCNVFVLGAGLRQLIILLSVGLVISLIAIYKSINKSFTKNNLTTTKNQL